MNKLKVLYVDDEPINLILFKANLEDKYDVLTAENGFEGLKFISENSDLKVVVSDMKMPNMNGIEFIKKAVSISPRIHYYILTGFEITDEIQEALDVGLIRRYFRKPFNMNDISSEIENASERRES
jgi:two-component system, response regulator, stage 0 sporulation protein F